MSQLLYGLAALACPVGMGVMMWMMMRGGHGTNQPDTPPPHAMAPSMPPAGSSRPVAEEIAGLRAELDQLRAIQRDRAAGSGEPGR